MNSEMQHEFSELFIFFIAAFAAQYRNSMPDHYNMKYVVHCTVKDNTREPVIKNAQFWEQFATKIYYSTIF